MDLSFSLLGKGRIAEIKKRPLWKVKQHSITESYWEGQVMESIPNDEALVGPGIYILITCYRFVTLKAETLKNKS